MNLGRIHGCLNVRVYSYGEYSLCGQQPLPRGYHGVCKAYYAVVADKSAYAIYSFACIYAFLQLLKLIYQLIR